MRQLAELEIVLAFVLNVAWMIRLVVVAQAEPPVAWPMKAGLSPGTGTKYRNGFMEYLIGVALAGVVCTVAMLASLIATASSIRRYWARLPPITFCLLSWGSPHLR